MNYLPPDNGLNERAASAAFAVQLARIQLARFEAEQEVAAADDDVSRVVTERVRRHLVRALPDQEFRDRSVKAIDPDGELKLIVALTMTRIREEVRTPSGINPFDIVRSMAFDPGVDEADIQTLLSYVELLEKDASLSAPPRHKKGS